MYDVTEDNQGRIVLPAELKEYAHIDKEIVITGAASYLRIEAAEQFSKRTAGMNMADVFAKLNAIGKKE